MFFLPPHQGAHWSPVSMMEDQALVLLRMCQRAQTTGSLSDRMIALDRCQALMEEINSSMLTINDVLPDEILLDIFTRVAYDIFGRSEKKKRSWGYMRQVCRRWKDVSNSMDINTHSTFRYEDVNIRDIIRPFTRRFDAFPNIRHITIPLERMPGKLGFDRLMRFLEIRKNGIEELVFQNKNAKALCLGMQELGANMWKEHKWFLRNSGITSLALQGKLFSSTGPHLTRFVVQGGKDTLTRLSMPNLGQRLQHLGYNIHQVEHGSNVYRHALCKKEPYCQKRKMKPFDLSSMICLETLELGSIDLSCNNCMLFLPPNLKTLMIHRPDASNLAIPDSLHLYVRFDRLVLKHVGEGAFYSDDDERSLSKQPEFNRTEAQRRFTHGLAKGIRRFLRAKSQLAGEEPDNIDRYEQYLLGLESVKEVSIDSIPKCNSLKLMVTKIRKLDLTCWTVTIDLVEEYRPTKRKSVGKGAFPNEKKKRKSVR